jgi:DNA-binding response OmpR family regulator
VFSIDTFKSGFSFQFTPTTFAIFHDKKTKLFLESKQYLDELGFGLCARIEIEDGKFRLTGTDNYITNLSNQESRLLTFLIQNKNKYVTFEEIAKLLWEEEWASKYSSSSISKLVSQIRQKLVVNGVWWNPIKTKRGLGYVYVDN